MQEKHEDGTGYSDFLDMARSRMDAAYLGQARGEGTKLALLPPPQLLFAYPEQGPKKKAD